MILALMGGTSGSSSPCRISVGCRSLWSQRTLVQPAAQARGLCELAGELRLLAHLAPVDFTGNLCHVSRVLVASWRGYFQQHRRMSGYHQRPGSRTNQDYPAAALRKLISELLGKSTTPRNTQHIDLLVAQLIEHLCRQPGQGRKTVRDERGR